MRLSHGAMPPWRGKFQRRPGMLLHMPCSGRGHGRHTALHTTRTRRRTACRSRSQTDCPSPSPGNITNRCRYTLGNIWGNRCRCSYRSSHASSVHILSHTSDTLQYIGSDYSSQFLRWVSELTIQVAAYRHRVSTDAVEQSPCQHQTIKPFDSPHRFLSPSEFCLDHWDTFKITIGIRFAVYAGSKTSIEGGVTTTRTY